MKNFYRFLFLFALLPLAAMGEEYGWQDAGKVTISQYLYSTLSASQDIRFVDVPDDVVFKVYRIEGTVNREVGSESSFTVHLKELSPMNEGAQENNNRYIFQLSSSAGVIIYASKPGEYKYQTWGSNSQHRASSSTKGSCPSYTYSFSNMLVPGDDNLTIGEVMANATLSPEVTAFIEEFGEPSAASKRRAEENEGEIQAGSHENYYYYKLTVGSKEGFGHNKFGFFWGADNGSGDFMIPADKCALSIPRTSVSSSIRLTNTSLILGEEDGLVSRLELVPMGDAPAFPAATGFYDLSGKSYPAYLSKNANGCLRGITIENGRKTIR